MIGPRDLSKRRRHQQRMLLIKTPNAVPQRVLREEDNRNIGRHDRQAEDEQARDGGAHERLAEPRTPAVHDQADRAQHEERERRHDQDREEGPQHVAEEPGKAPHSRQGRRRRIFRGNPVGDALELHRRAPDHERENE